MPLAPDLPKADMHVHLEGTMTPGMTRRLAARNGVALRPGLFTPDGTGYRWQGDGTPRGDLIAFVNAYDDATAAMKTAQDYYDITRDFLSRWAAQGCVYAQAYISADHAAQVGVTYREMVDAIAAATADARAQSGIEARFLSTAVRHYGPKRALEAARMTADYPHPLVTGFSVAGDENAHAFADFLPAFEASGLRRWHAHAGEAAGPQSVRAARDTLGIRHFGHMVRAEEDPLLLEELLRDGAVPEICVSSNMALRTHAAYKDHPLRRYAEAGFAVCLGSDDPPFFHTDIAREYEIAHAEFGFSPRALLRVTQNGIAAAFVDEDTRAALRARVSAWEAACPPAPAAPRRG